MRVKIETQEQAIHFVDICNRYPNDDIDLIFQRFIVDAKSILGVMALMVLLYYMSFLYTF